MVQVRVRERVAPEDLAMVTNLARAAEVADGHPALGDAVWRDLAHPSASTVLLFAYEHDHPVGALHLAAENASGSRRVAARVVIDPEHRDGLVARTLLDAGVEQVRRLGGGRLELWAFGAGASADAFASASGFHKERELWQMRVALPLGGAASWPPGIEVRRFVPGQDEAAWLEVNNRAFAADPDQGGWTLDVVQERAREPWFDPAGFLLAYDAVGLAGSCWTKIHPRSAQEPETLGEIYVIGVDPSRQGTGLGRALVLGGLTSLFERGATMGMLFVDGDNTAAVALYRALGFVPARIDRAYVQDIA